LVTIRNFRLAATLLASACAFAAWSADSPCPRGDKECARKLIAKNPLKDSAHWRAALSRPLAERIGAAPPEVVEFLALDVIANDYPNRPRAATLDPAFMADVRRAFDEVPAPVKKLLEPRLAGIFFVEDIGGTGFTESTRDAKAGFIVLDPAVLAKRGANAWATWKDATPFKPDAAWRIETRIEEASRDDRARAIQFILLHEIGHVLSIGAKVHPDWNVDPKDIGPGEQYYFYNLSWTVAGGRYASRFDAAFPQRKDVVFYFGPKLEARDMRATYEALEKTAFPTLYAATHPADDFAESFASYVHVVLMGRGQEVRIYRDGKLEKSYGPCWGEARCAYKRTALESALGLPVTR
jgi:hypothetical protein